MRVILASAGDSRQRLKKAIVPASYERAGALLSG